VSKENLQFDDQSERGVFFLLLWCFLKGVENMLSSYRDTCGSLGELEIAVETLACRLVLTEHFLLSQTPTCVSITK